MTKTNLIRILFLLFVILITSCSSLESKATLIQQDGNYFTGLVVGETKGDIRVPHATVYFNKTPYGPLEGKVITVKEGNYIKGSAVSLSKSGSLQGVGSVRGGTYSQKGQLFLRNDEKIQITCDLCVETVVIDSWSYKYGLQGFGVCESLDGKTFKIIIEP